MLGDGLNDAPALASADIGISMGISGSALASETGDIILMSNDLRKIPEAIKLARKARRKVIENIALSVITKVAILALAIAGHPIVWAAVLADVGTCLLVILNSMLLLPRGHKHGGKTCKSSNQHHVHKNGCGDTNDGSSHHHHHDHHHHQHQHQHHSHKHCCSEKAQPQKCVSQSCSSKNPSCTSNQSLSGNVNPLENMENHDHCHQGSCDKSQDGVQKHNIENKCCSDSHDLNLNAEDIGADSVNRHGNCQGHKSHGTKHCHNKNINMDTHGHTSLGSHCHLSPCDKKETQQVTKHCHLNHGCENLKDHGTIHDIQHQKSGFHSNFKKHGTDEISIDIITEHVESASMHGCSSLAEKEKDSCKDCSKLPVVCGGCEGPNEREVSSCCKNEGYSKESMESSIMHACISFDKREVGGCCKSYMKECCGRHGHSGAGSFVGLSEIVTE